MATILIPYALRAFTERNAEAQVGGDTAGAALHALAEKYPDIKAHLFTDDGAPRDFINLFVDGKNINSLNGLDTSVNDDTELMIVPAIAGGNHNKYYCGYYDVENHDIKYYDVKNYNVEYYNVKHYNEYYEGVIRHE